MRLIEVAGYPVKNLKPVGLKITAPHEVRLILGVVYMSMYWLCLKITAPHEVRLINLEIMREPQRYGVSQNNCPTRSEANQI